MKTNAKRGQSLGETHQVDAAPDEASENVIPMTRQPRPEKSEGQERTDDLGTLALEGDGQLCGDTQNDPAVADPSNDGQTEDETHPNAAVEGGDQNGSEAHANYVPAAPLTPKQEALIAGRADMIAEIIEVWRRKSAWHRTEKGLTLTIKALCRRSVEGGSITLANKLYDALIKGTDHPMAIEAYAATFPLIEGRAPIEKNRKLAEKRLTQLCKDLPVADFVAETRGFSWKLLAGVTGEAGDLLKYSNPAKLWKRLGLAVMPDGGRQRKVKGAAAIEHGYSPSRRSVVWNIGACLIKAGKANENKGTENSYYYQVYIDRKAYEFERNPDMKKAHAANRAQRYMEKRLIKKLWQAWRNQAATPPLKSMSGLPPEMPLVVMPGPTKFERELCH